MSTITFLYSMVAIVTFVGYIPQIINLWNTQSDCRDVSLSTWVIWSGTSLVSLLYSYYEIADLHLCITAGINLTCILVITSLVLYKSFYENKLSL